MISNVTCLLFLSQTDLILCFYTDNTVHLFWLQDTFTCFTLYILVKYSDMYIFHYLFLVTSFSSFCHHQAKYLQSKTQSNSNVFLILVACSTTLLQLVEPYQKLVPPLRYTYWSLIVSYILDHIITHSLCAANFIYKMRAQTSPHLTRTSTCPAKLHTAINSIHHSFMINRLDHLFLPIPHLILTGKLL